MAKLGWKRLLDEADWARGAGRYPISAYSEFMPPPRCGFRAYGGGEPVVYEPHDPFGWLVSEYEELAELLPGFTHIAQRLMTVLEHLGEGRAAHGIARAKLEGNPYWPQELAARAGTLDHERYVTLAPLALSRTQDDKGRVRWTLFGGSEQGPEQGFWKGFWLDPRREVPAEEGLSFFRQLLQEAFGEPAHTLTDLRKAGLRILPSDGHAFDHWQPTCLPSWTTPLLLKDREPLGKLKWLITFRPFGRLPRGVQKAYLAGDLHLLPFPGSLVFWGAPPMLKLQRALPLAMQVPLLNSLERHEAVHAIRIPQSGWMHEPHPDLPEPEHHHGPLRNTYRRTHRWQRVHRHEDELLVTGHEDRLAHVLFSTAAEDVGLYGKPMARNAQVWTTDFRLLLDGPQADRRALEDACRTIHGGGQFGYRFYYPPMHVGPYAVFWQRPLVAYRHAESGAARLVPCAPAGYLTAYHGAKPNLARPVELWPRRLHRELHAVAVTGFKHSAEHPEHRLAINVRKLLNAWRLLGRKPLPRPFVRQLLTLTRHESLADWFTHIEQLDVDNGTGEWMSQELQTHVGPPSQPPAIPRPLTFTQTARRSFETQYWKTIARLATKFINKDNADCVTDPVTRELRHGCQRELQKLGDYLLAYYDKVIAAHGMTGQALAGELPFRWQTDFEFPWMGGWRENQEGREQERNLLVRIPGRDRTRAVIMADHYDTAYMEDLYEPERGGRKARVAAAGADDNHSATAALMLAAPVLMKLSRAGKLGCDVWLVHLTGEEFPSDCLGARHLAQSVVEGTLKLRVPGRRPIDLSKTRVQGVYVLDMVAHNNPRDPDVFQIAPGASAESMRLAWHAHMANALWNHLAPQWNQRPERKDCKRGVRSEDPARVPDVALHPTLSGEVRPPMDPRSALYNTDGQIFSDAGVPVVLFMENYDINRQGYHDTHDTMANIDLDYGAAVAAIAIETVARAAAEG